MRRSIPLAALTALVAVYGCANEQTAPAVVTMPPVTSFDTSNAATARWGRFHSSRFELSIGLPDGHGWKIDDHSSPSLIALHTGTASRVEVRTFVLHDMANHQRCEAEAMEQGLVPKNATTVDTTDETRADGFDTHTWVALEPSQTLLRGHVLAFGARMRRCFVFHFATEIASTASITTAAQNEMSDRLALAATRISHAITFDPGMVETDSTLPRAAH